MLTDEQMLQIAERYLQRLEKDNDMEMLIYPDEIIKKPYGNVYTFDSKEFLINGDRGKELMNKYYFLVEKKTGRVVKFGTLGTIENQLKDYENDNMGLCLNTYWYPDEDRFDYK
ncbi:hypothetical protein BWK59_10315 [Flavobacterium davisii]|uniref:Immunity protein 35 domain-containing protein n=1 Tax=Flavobacterium davisii TaxID=2906077 RepID=A0A246GH07_9FLAO|nr:hypothetical protein [Flavobacterium davisii]OWP83470.1 hypothetical protein BWK59_10315 [Flavobacterium davisii]